MKFQMTAERYSDTNDQYRFESCISRGTNQKTRCEKENTRREIGYKSAIKIQKQFKIHIKTKLKFTDPTCMHGKEESLRRTSREREQIKK